jgi:GNAT superfamily N-acetyltransferase
MTTLAADSRYQLVDGGARIVRLAGDAGIGWLREYRTILRMAAADFLTRGHFEGDRDLVVAELAEILSLGGGVWLVVDQEYRLLGFAAMRLRRAAWANRLVAEIPGVYLYPKRTPRRLFRRLFDAMIAWATAEGAAELCFTSRRPVRGVEAITGATVVGQVYSLPLTRAT